MIPSLIFALIILLYYCLIQVRDISPCGLYPGPIQKFLLNVGWEHSLLFSALEPSQQVSLCMMILSILLGEMSMAIDVLPLEALQTRKVRFFNNFPLPLTLFAPGCSLLILECSALFRKKSKSPCCKAMSYAKLYKPIAKIRTLGRSHFHRLKARLLDFFLSDCTIRVVCIGSEISCAPTTELR